VRRGVGGKNVCSRTIDAADVQGEPVPRVRKGSRLEKRTEPFRVNWRAVKEKKKERRTGRPFYTKNGKKSTGDGMGGFSV